MLIFIKEINLLHKQQQIPKENTQIKIKLAACDSLSDLSTPVLLSLSRSLSLKLVLYIVSGRLVHSLHSFLSFLLLLWQSKAKQKQNIVCLASTLPLSSLLSDLRSLALTLCVSYAFYANDSARQQQQREQQQEQQLLCCGARTPAATSASVSLLWGFVISAVKFCCT